MASAAVDHMISLTVFTIAILIFISLFSQNIQTAVVYQGHQVLSTKTSDLLDTILLTPGLPMNWGKNDTAPTCFGLQDPEYPKYKLSTFSLMHLNSANTETQVYYPRTGTYYSNISAGFGSYLLAPSTKTLNNSVVSKMLGINGTYGFQFTLTPLLTVSNIKVSEGAPLTFDVHVEGIGYTLANASITYSLILVHQDPNGYPAYTITSGSTTTDGTGSAQVVFAEVNGETQSYAFIAYSYLYGLKGMGYCIHVPQSLTKSVVPLIDSFKDQTVLIAHSDSVGEQAQNPPYSQLSYNASFAILTDEYTLRQVALDTGNSVGTVTVGSGSPSYVSINVPDNDGILIVTYRDTVSGGSGLVLMPWGLGSMAFPLTFGGNPAGQEWVTTDIREVTIGGFAYQAQLALWSLQGVSRTG
jgi:hypothetical protein